MHGRIGMGMMGITAICMSTIKKNMIEETKRNENQDGNRKPIDVRVFAVRAHMNAVEDVRRTEMCVFVCVCVWRRPNENKNKLQA